MEKREPGGGGQTFRIDAPGFSAAELFWAGGDGKVLPGWTSFACEPLRDGRACLVFPDSLAVPEGASAVLCRAVSGDGRTAEQVLDFPTEAALDFPAEMAADFPAEERTAAGGGYCFTVASDLHISNKPAPFSRLYECAVGSDGLLLAGDTVNDGTGSQFAFMRNCVTESWKKFGIFLPIFTVCGNHDVPLKPLPDINAAGQGGYPVFQKWLERRAESVGYDWDQHDSGAYAVKVGADLEVIGLQCVSHFRRFVFRDGTQLEWLEEHLDENDHLKWHIILCHAPLLNHNPQRMPGKDAAYLSRDEKLQSILDAHHNMIFISGHTHFSLNNRPGCVEWEASRQNLYLNVGSIRKTTMKAGKASVPRAWTEGNAVRLRIAESEVEVEAFGLYTGNRQARGYYRFHTA
ncbi:metallophosphoesterase family protein [Enterocloster lavalensis]|uniref:metallophosphoesterase family protein n=1 Tax=Enterocloster lavalensis TaxID=460384 RepID=UPI0011C216BE|nr:metallophosphoesterase [Enterocloster lavalensis]